jgi:hypothetical protein
MVKILDTDKNLFSPCGWIEFVSRDTKLTENSSHMFSVDATVIGDVLLAAFMHVESTCCVQFINNTRQASFISDKFKCTFN